MERYSFQKGFNQVKLGRRQVVKDKIMNALNLKIAAWYARLNGNVEPKVSEAKTIERIFSEERPPIKDIWGTDVKVPENHTV
jgi:hypothetical protein